MKLFKNEYLWYRAIRLRVFTVLMISIICFIGSLYGSDNPAAGKNIKHILVLHSYHSTMKWIENVNQSIDDILQPGNNYYVIHREYMDTKRVYTEEYLDSLIDVYRKKYKDVKLDLIMSSGNDAYDFLRKNRDEIFGEVPVSFCGVKFFNQSDLAGIKNFTGSVESFNAFSTINVARKLYPKIKKVYIINDYLKTGRAWESSVKEQLSGIDDLEFIYAPDLPISELRKEVSELGDDTVVLLGSYFKDKAGAYYTYEKIGKLISGSSTSPVFNLLEFNYGKGVVGGYYQGEAMSQIAKRILNGEKPSDVPIIAGGTTKFIFDHNGLKRSGIAGSLVLAGSVVMNPHKNRSFLDSLTEDERRHLTQVSQMS